MRRVAISCVLLVLAAAPALANFCARDAVPAATLLFPYVEVAMTAAGEPDAGGQTTISQVTNVGKDSIVVRFTVWDLAGVPRIWFNEFLSGYDTLQINWRDFLNGRFDLFDTSRVDFTPASPRTFDPFEWGPDGRAQSGGLTTPQNRGAITTQQCPEPSPPFGNRHDLAAKIVSLFRGAQVARTHLGCGSTLPREDQSWFGSALDGSKLSFYVTADIVVSCDLLQPTEAAYWSGVAGNANVLTGYAVYLDARANTSEMVTAVHIEAATDATSGGPSVVGFYEEKTGGVETNREPLATAFMLPYANDQPAGITSSIILWKNFTELSAVDDPEKAQWGSVSDCGSYLYYAWDADERSLAQTSPITSLPVWALVANQFPFAAQKVPLNNGYFDLPGPYGWLLIALPPSYGGDFTDPTPDQFGYRTRPYMGWAAVQLNYGTYSAGAEGITVANALCFPSQVLPDLGVNQGTSAIR